MSDNNWIKLYQREKRSRLITETHHSKRKDNVTVVPSPMVVGQNFGTWRHQEPQTQSSMTQTFEYQNQDKEITVVRQHFVGTSRQTETATMSITKNQDVTMMQWNFLDNKQHDSSSSNEAVADVNDNHGNTLETCQPRIGVDDDDVGGDGSFHGLVEAELPDVIRESYQYYSKLDYAFIHAMAYVFGSNVCRSGSYFRIKMSLMLGLVMASSEENLKNNCSLLVINDDDLIIDRLFRWSCSLARNHFIHFSHLHTLAAAATATTAVTSKRNVSATAIPERCHHQSEPCTNSRHSLSSSSKRRRNGNVFGPNSNHAEGYRKEAEKEEEFANVGTLNLAFNGIHVFGVNSLNLMPIKERAYLEHALESNEIVVAGGDPATVASNGPNEEATTTELLRTVIWAQIHSGETEAMSFCHSTKPKSNLQNLFKQQSLSLTEPTKTHWADLFANVWMAVKNPGLYLPDFDGAIITTDEWRRYIDICSKIDPIMITEAEDIVKLYFVMNRQFRSTIPIRSISVIFSMARSIAKLNLHRYVKRTDAILAVLLYEEQLLSRYPERRTPFTGFSFFDLTHIGQDQKTTKDNHQIGLSTLLDDSYMKSFEVALMRSFHHHQGPV